MSEERLSEDDCRKLKMTLCKCRPIEGYAVAFCAMHGAAPELLQALKQAQCALYNTPSKNAEFHDYLDSVIAKAEGKA